jgi:hypothetical protein
VLLGGEIPGFDEVVYVAHAGFDDRSLPSLLEEYASVRGLAFHMAGHELHHIRVVEERYVPLLPRES